VNDVGDKVSAAAASNIAGDLAGSAPRITQYGSMLFIALQNKDTGRGGGVLGGTSTLIVCEKPTSGNAIGACAHFVANSADYSGQFPSIVVTGSKVVLSNTGANEKLLLTACDFDSASTTASGAINASSCRSTTLLNDHQGLYTSLAFNGSRAVVATYDKSPGGYGDARDYRLKLTACSINSSDNSFDQCATIDADTSYSTDGAIVLAPGAYPSLILDGSKVYVAYQLGETKRIRLRLTNVSFSGVANAFDMGSLSTQAVSSVSSTGATPRLALSGSGASGYLWVTSSSYSSQDNNGSDATVNVWKCALTAGAPSCAGVYHTQNTDGIGPIYSRSVWLDTTNKILIAPFTSNDVDNINRNGLFQIGLWPEL
jgi:hypothetical protein